MSNLEGFVEAMYTKGVFLEHEYSGSKFGPYFDQVIYHWLQPDDLRVQAEEMLWQLHDLSPAFAVKNRGVIIGFAADEVHGNGLSGVQKTDTYGRKGLLEDVAEAGRLVLPQVANISFPEVVPAEVTLKSTGPNRITKQYDTTNLRSSNEINGFSGDHFEERDIPFHMQGLHEVLDTDGSVVKREFIPGRFQLTSVPINAVTVGSSRFDLRQSHNSRVFPLATGSNRLHSMLFIQPTAYSFADIASLISARKRGSRFQPRESLHNLLKYFEPRLRNHPVFATPVQYRLDSLKESLPYLAHLFAQDLRRNFWESQMLARRGVVPQYRTTQNKHWEGTTDYESWRVNEGMPTSARNIFSVESQQSVNLLGNITNILSSQEVDILADLVMPEVDRLKSDMPHVVKKYREALKLDFN